MRLIPLVLAFIMISCSTTPPEPRRARTVYVAETAQGFTLIRNSLPFKIKGAAGSAKHIKSLAEAGGNTLRVYDTTNLKSVLNEALVNNIAVVVDIPLASYQSSYYKSQLARDSTVIKIKNLVNAHKDHPALLVWMLGNELRYPSDFFLDDRQQSYIAFFNTLVNQIHQLDPNHPVSTSIASIEKKKIFNLMRKSPELDFISINIFGQIYEMESEIDKLSLFWKGPYLISEWGAEGPWTNRRTFWNAAIEYNDAEKALEIQKIYNQYLQSSSSRSLGDLVFYWGEKQESTHTWFSLLDSTGRKSNMAYSIARYFQGAKVEFNKGPMIESMALNTRDRWANIILEPSSLCSAKIEHQPLDSLNIKWEIMAEGWNVIENKKETRPESYPLVGNSDHITFQAPEQEGPYRLFVYLYDTHDNFTSANIPFYVLR